MRPTRKPLTDATRRTLGVIAQHGAAERRWRSHHMHDYSWFAGGRTDQSVSRNVMALYGAGYLEPDKGDPHRLKISAEGYRALGAEPLDQKRAA